MPLITKDSFELTKAVEKTLVSHGALTPVEEFRDHLTVNGATVAECASTLADLLVSGKENTRHKVALDILAAHGVEIRQEAKATIPSIQFVIQGDNTNLNQLFAPERTI